MTKHTERVRIELYAAHLKNVAGAFKGTSDPYCVVTLLPNNPDEKPSIVGKTEVVKNTLSPRWTKTIEIEYTIGALTRFNVGIYDEIRKASTNKPMGSAMFEVGEVLGTRGNLKAKKLRTGGTLFCRIVAAPPKSAGVLRLGLRGVGLKNVDGMFSKSDPFVEISAKMDSTGGGLSWQPVFRSKHIQNNLNPVFPTFSLDLNRFCADTNNPDMDVKDRPVLISFWDWEKSGKHKSLGQFETTVGGLLQAQTPNAGSNVNAKQVNTSRAFILYRAKNTRKEFGKVVVVEAAISGGDDGSGGGKDVPTPTPSPVPVPVPFTPPAAAARPTFVDYLSGGCELELSIAIDFTGSNGDPRKPGTLHYIHRDGQLNDYEKAFTSVGSIVARYDSNQQFPVYGFGAKYGGILRNCFQVGPKSEVHGIAEALDAYRNVFKSGLTMSGPTVFAEVIDVAAARARSAQEQAERIGQQTYGILLILTDGAVSDINLTKQALQRANDAPLSIVIVGVGQADFSTMQFLDDFADSDPQLRDICQFVQFNRYLGDKSALTRETLDEIPDQLVNYFHDFRGIKPLPPVHGSQLSLAASDCDEEDIDLTIGFTSEDEIVLDDTQGLPSYDDTQYQNAAAFLVPPVPVPATPYQHSNAAAPPGRMNASAPPAVTTPAAPYYPEPVPPPPSARQPQQQAAAPQPPPFSQALDGPPQQRQVFHVQVPAGIYSGERLQVQNPKTNQYMVVTVPEGVRPGGKFAVAY